MKIETEDLGIGFVILVLLLGIWIAYNRYDTVMLLVILFISLVVLSIVLRMQKWERREGNGQPDINEVKQEVEKPTQQPKATEPIPEPLQTEPTPQAMFLQCPPIPEIQIGQLHKKKRHRRKRKSHVGHLKDEKSKPKEVDPIAFRETEESQETVEFPNAEIPPSPPIVRIPQ